MDDLLGAVIRSMLEDSGGRPREEKRLFTV